MLSQIKARLTPPEFAHSSILESISTGRFIFNPLSSNILISSHFLRPPQNTIPHLPDILCKPPVYISAHSRVRFCKQSIHLRYQASRTAGLNPHGRHYWTTPLIPEFPQNVHSSRKSARPPDSIFRIVYILSFFSIINNQLSIIIPDAGWFQVWSLSFSGFLVPSRTRNLPAPWDARFSIDIFDSPFFILE
jgi:hypothetical protein